MSNITNVGTTIKYSIRLELPNMLHAEDVAFSCEFYCYKGRSLVIEKSDMNMIDADTYVALVDTNVIGAGMVHCKVTVTLPDAVAGTREEIVTVCTHDEIER